MRDAQIHHDRVSSDDDDATLARLNDRSRSRKLDRHIALVGFMGAGKSTLGAMLATELDRPFFDSDVRVQEKLGSTVQELFAEGRATEFRQAEETSVEELLEGPRAVISLGGGALESARTRSALLRRCFVIHLYVSWAEVRVSLNELSGDRPLLQRPLSEVHELYLRRQKTYRDAHVRIHVPRNDFDSAVRHILYALRRDDRA